MNTLYKKLIEIIDGNQVVINSMKNNSIANELLDYISEKKGDGYVIIEDNVGDIFCDKNIISISKTEMEGIWKIYSLYEFTDQIIYFIDSVNYPSLFNYVNTEILTEDELLQAIFERLDR